MHFVKNIFVESEQLFPAAKNGVVTPAPHTETHGEYIMRIDKFLKVSRILKRRTVANDACNGGRVSVNGKDVKPAYNLKAGDVVELRFGGGTLKFRVLDLKETVRKEEAQNLYEIIQ